MLCNGVKFSWNVGYRKKYLMEWVVFVRRLSDTVLEGLSGFFLLLIAKYKGREKQKESLLITQKGVGTYCF